MNLIFIVILLVLTIPLLILLVKKRDNIFLLLMSLVFLISWIADELLLVPHFFTWSIETVIGILFINYLLPKIVFLRKIEITPIGKYLLFLLIYVLFGGFIYFINFSDILLGLRAFFKYAFLFLIFINSNFSKESYKKFFRYWLYFMAAQPIVALFQYFILGHTDDLIYGTLRSTGIAAVLLIVFIMCLIELINQKKVNNYIIYSLIFLSMTVIPIFGEAKAFFYLLPIVFVIRYADSLLKMNYKNILQFILPFLFVLYLFQSFYNVNLFQLGEINTSNFLFSQDKGGIEAFDNQKTLAISLSERFLSIVSLYDTGFLGSDLKRFFFGDGIGSHIFNYETREIFSLSTSESFIQKFSLSNFIQNIGFIGFLIFCFLFIRISYYSYRASFMVKDKFFKSIYSIIPAFSALFLISMFYTNPFEDAISFSYWFFVSSLVYYPKINTHSI